MSAAWSYLPFAWSRWVKLSLITIALRFGVELRVAWLGLDRIRSSAAISLLHTPLAAPCFLLWKWALSPSVLTCRGNTEGRVEIGVFPLVSSLKDYQGKNQFKKSMCTFCLQIPISCKSPCVWLTKQPVFFPPKSLPNCGNSSIEFPTLSAAQLNSEKKEWEKTYRIL